MVVGNLGKQIILISTHAEATPQTEEMSVNVFLECREYFKLYIKKFKESKYLLTRFRRCSLCVHRKTKQK